MKYVISLGGSLIAPENIDVAFLKEFKKLIESFNDEFVIVTGGGKTCRKYIQSASEISEISDEDKDWIGIKATKLNAELVRSIFGKVAYEKVIDNPNKKITTTKKIIIGSGWKPGCSSDKDAVLLAKNIGAKTVINLTNTDYVYDKDPKLPDAKPLKNITWNELRKITGNKWVPGMNVPFDPIAAKLAQKLNLKVVVMNGRNLSNLKDFFEGKEFVGSVVEQQSI